MERLAGNRNADRSRSTAARQRNAADRGQTLLEFALMLPLMLLLAVGVVDAGRAIFYTIAANNAASAGVEYGSHNTTTAQDLTGMKNTAICDANGGTEPACSSGILSTDNTVATYGCNCDTSNNGSVSCTHPVPPTSTCATSCAGTRVWCVQVTTNATISPLFSWPGLPSSYPVGGWAVRRVRDTN